MERNQTHEQPPRDEMVSAGLQRPSREDVARAVRGGPRAMVELLRSTAASALPLDWRDSRRLEPEIYGTWWQQLIDVLEDLTEEVSWQEDTHRGQSPEVFTADQLLDGVRWDLETLGQRYPSSVPSSHLFALASRFGTLRERLKNRRAETFPNVGDKLILGQTDGPTVVRQPENPMDGPFLEIYTDFTEEAMHLMPPELVQVQCERMRRALRRKVVEERCTTEGRPPRIRLVLTQPVRHAYPVHQVPLP